MAAKLTESIETSNKVNVGVSKSVQDSLHSIESHLSADSQIFQQLAECRTSYGWLKGKLGAIEPTLESLNTSVKVMSDSENKLVQQFGDFGKKLAAAQMPKGNPDFEKQLANKFDENTQLQLCLQKMSSEIDSLKQLASQKDATIQNLQQSLAGANEKCRSVENRNQVLEIEKTALKGEIELRDQRIRHDLTAEHTSSQNQMQAQYEQKLRNLKAEKDSLEKSAELVMTQLSGVQNALVSHLTAHLTAHSTAHSTALIAGTKLTVPRLKQNVWLMTREHSVNHWYVTHLVLWSPANPLRPKRQSNGFNSSLNLAPSIWRK